MMRQYHYYKRELIIMGTKMNTFLIDFGSLYVMIS